MSDYEFDGRHVIADLYDVSDDAISNEELILAGLLAGIARSGATVCGMQSKRFEPAGLTAVYLLSESHVSVHTYPEQNALFLDAFTCGQRCQPEEIVKALVDALGPCQQRVSVLGRGRSGADIALQLAMSQH